MHIDSCVAVTVSSLDAMHMLKSAWEDVNQSSIVNCFGKAGFTNSNPCQKMTMIRIQKSLPMGYPLRILMHLWI